MKPAPLRVISALVSAALGTALASSCSMPLRTEGDARLPAQSNVPGPTSHVAQLDFGRRAGFATCLPPACPAFTPKTLAGDVPPVALTPRPIEATASLDRGEILVASNARPTPRAAPVTETYAQRSAEPMTNRATVYFAFGNAALSPAARASIDDAAGALSAARRVAISGRTDNVGPSQVNEALALARANAVRDHLRARYPNLAPVVTLEAKGVCCFAAPNETARGRALNRRVEVVFEHHTKEL